MPGDVPADSNWRDGLKLSEYPHGLFFAANGESAQFPRRIALGNRPFVNQA
jgi:hypothetical protein